MLHNPLAGKDAGEGHSIRLWKRMIEEPVDKDRMLI